MLPVPAFGGYIARVCRDPILQTVAMEVKMVEAYLPNCECMEALFMPFFIFLIGRRYFV